MRDEYDFSNAKRNPYSFGGRIKKLRELRGLTQQELGILCGFSENTAQARICQYEKMSRSPNKIVLLKIAEALNFNEFALTDRDVYSYYNVIHTLFDMEEQCELIPVKIGEHIYLDFCGTTSYGKKTEYHEYYWFLNKWYDTRKKTKRIRLMEI